MSGYDLLVEFVHRTGVESTAHFQNWFAFFGDFLVWISVVFDPMYTYTLYFPLLYHLNRVTGLQILWTGALSEWLNHVFKCILFGERPYWWVQQNSQVWENLNMTAPHLLQTPITCETGPGSPSGHVMVNAAVGFVFVKGILGKTKLGWLRTLSWTLYFVCLLFIAVSRVYVAAHFPHQCFFGLLSGVCLGYVLYKLLVINMRLRYQAFLTVVMAASALGTYNLIQYLGIDPGWTIPLAKKWCFRAEWVHLNTTLFYMFWRYMGTVIGIALSLKCLRKCSWTEHFNLLQVVVLAIASALAVKLITSFIVKDGDEYIVYLSAFAVHVLLPYVVVVALPGIMVKLLRFVSHQEHID